MQPETFFEPERVHTVFVIGALDSQLAKAATAIEGAGPPVVDPHLEPQPRRPALDGDAFGGALTSAQTVEELMKQLQAKPVPPCDAPAWTLFGISMAGYNMLFSAILAILAFGAARKP